MNSDYILRLFLFMISYYFIIEYTYSCKISNNIGIFNIIIVIFITSLLFCMKIQNVSKCDNCKHYSFKGPLNLFQKN